MIHEPLAQDRPLALPRGRRALRWAGLVLLGLALAAASLALARRWASAPATVSATRFSVAAVERGAFVRDIAAEGRVVAANSPTLVAPAAGLVTLKVNAGDTVQRGQVLAIVDSPELAARLAQELSVSDNLRAEVLRAEVEGRQTRATLAGTLDNTRIDLQSAETDLKRQTAAFEAGAVAQAQVEQARDRLEKARIALRQAQDGVGLKDDALRFELQSKRLAHERQQLVVRELRRQVDDLQVRSLLAGQVGQTFVAERANVGRDTRLLTLVDLSELEVQVQVAESLARDLAAGMPGEITGNGQRWTGTVSRISPEVVNGEVSARIRFADGAAVRELRQNQRLQVRVLLDRRDGVLTMRRGSFVDENGGAAAYVLKDGVAEKRRIRLGARSIDKVEVLDGLAVGEQVVVSGSAAFDGADRAAVSP